MARRNLGAGPPQGGAAPRRDRMARVDAVAQLLHEHFSQSVDPDTYDWETDARELAARIVERLDEGTHDG